MGDVFRLRDVVADKLARELRVSVAFVELCLRSRIDPQHAKVILGWFLSLPLADRIAVIRNVIARKARTEE